MPSSGLRIEQPSDRIVEPAIIDAPVVTPPAPKPAAPEKKN